MPRGATDIAFTNQFTVRPFITVLNNTRDSAPWTNQKSGLGRLAHRNENDNSQTGNVDVLHKTPPSKKGYSGSPKIWECLPTLPIRTTAMTKS